MQPLKPIPNSKQITAAAFDPADCVLSIQFANSAMRYDYQGVPPDVAAAFFDAESKGQFVAQKIKGLYHFEKVDTATDDDSREGELIVTKQGVKIDPRAAWPFPDKARA